ncbi:unnamed protein product [Mytilus edulis]|uniref:Uncharacterized protein n=1 Tax=Mytilus edulis TaxID=6550 RepID=A0A8S3SAD3_MYTED|nr:unnamed protein product [Mytilus edulis]
MESDYVTSVENTVTNSVAATSYACEAIIIEETTIQSSEWLLYTICITGAIMITASSHLLRSYRQRKSRLKNEKVVVESTTTSPYAGFYHEIDENIFKDVTPSLPLESHPSKMEAVCFIPQETAFITRSTELVNTDYLNPVFEPEDEVVVESTTTSPYTSFYHEIDENILKDVTPSLCLVSHPSKMEAVCFIPQETSFTTRSTELDNTDYLDPVFAAEDEVENSQQQQMHKKDNMSTCYSVSNVIVPLSIKSINPSQFTENQHEDMDGYEIPVTVHQYIERSSGSDEDAADYKYYHVYQSLQKKCLTKNNDYEKLRTAESKTVNKPDLTNQ